MDLDTPGGIKNRLHVFDMDGTIVDSAKIYDKMNVEYLESLGMEFNRQEFLNDKRDLPVDSIAELISTKYLRGSKTAQQVKDDLIRDAINTYSKLPVDTNAYRYINYLKLIGCKVALASANAKECVEAFLKSNNMENVFDAVLSNDSMDKTIPDKTEMFKKCVDLCNSSVNLTTIYEDSPRVIMLAMKGGLKNFYLINDSIEFDSYKTIFEEIFSKGYMVNRTNIEGMTHLKSFGDMRFNTDNITTLGRHIDFLRSMHEENMDALFNKSGYSLFEKVEIYGLVLPYRVVDNTEIVILPGFMCVLRRAAEPFGIEIDAQSLKDNCYVTSKIRDLQIKYALNILITNKII